MASHEFTSTRSPRIKGARRLAKRAFRQRERRFLVEGPQAVREALAAPGRVHELFTTADAAQRHAELIEAAERRGAAVHRVTLEVMAELAQTVTPQGVLAVCDFVDVPLGGLGPARLVAVLSHVRDPGNAGTVVRTADAAGADAVVFTDASVDPYNGKCVRASAGSLFHLPVVVGVPVADALARLRDAGARILAADGSGERDLHAVADDGGLDGRVGWVFGNEAWGLPEETVALTDGAVAVPIYGAAESLNLATAAAVCLYTTARQQRTEAGTPGRAARYAADA
ncbi:TrmH family RNA methyltransferase [Streptomonospora litoralis]|uniref:23S rRNA (Guanosine-2'-O-)-methyltransferase RlmB n=1 Tax=Streptomonospora litoralis TaxID=2498135 RepID=A0A4V0ZJY4_9ACTN|nr:RNA methyltransferase [Streptomonospora litoralis]QBI55092.1 23S rRNA (guanosine-2'-O-)-methyltransferase RlmB [Streptomonospora litoralis]